MSHRTSPVSWSYGRGGDSPRGAPEATGNTLWPLQVPVGGAITSPLQSPRGVKTNAFTNSPGQSPRKNGDPSDTGSRGNRRNSASVKPPFDASYSRSVPILNPLPGGTLTGRGKPVSQDGQVRRLSKDAIHQVSQRLSNPRRGSEGSSRSKPVFQSPQHRKLAPTPPLMVQGCSAILNEERMGSPRQEIERRWGVLREAETTLAERMVVLEREEQEVAQSRNSMAQEELRLEREWEVLREKERELESRAEAMARHEAATKDGRVEPTLFFDETHASLAQTLQDEVNALQTISKAVQLVDISTAKREEELQEKEADLRRRREELEEVVRRQQKDLHERMEEVEHRSREVEAWHRQLMEKEAALASLEEELKAREPDAGKRGVNGEMWAGKASRPVEDSKNEIMFRDLHLSDACTEREGTASSFSTPRQADQASSVAPSPYCSPEQ